MIERMTTVYHVEYGKGYILNVQYRYKNNLCMCSFPKGKTVFITEKRLRAGDDEVTLNPPSRQPRQTRGETLEDALRSILGG